MKLKCFECPGLVEAVDADALVEAFVAHGRESHAWSYPEQPIEVQERFTVMRRAAG